MSASRMSRHSELAVTVATGRRVSSYRSNGSSRSGAHWTICPLGRSKRVDGTRRWLGNLRPHHARVRLDVLPKEKQREDFDEDDRARQPPRENDGRGRLAYCNGAAGLWRGLEVQADHREDARRFDHIGAGMGQPGRPAPWAAPSY